MNSVNGHNTPLNIGSDPQQSQANLQDHSVKEALTVNQCAQPILDKTQSKPQIQNTFDVLQAAAQKSTPSVLDVEDDPLGDAVDSASAEKTFNVEVDEEEKSSLETTENQNRVIQEIDKNCDIKRAASFGLNNVKMEKNNSLSEKAKESSVVNQNENLVTETSVKLAAAKIEVRISEAQEAQAVDEVHESIRDIKNIHVDNSQGEIVPASTLTKDELKAKVAEKAFYVISGNHVYMSPEHAQAKGVKLNGTVTIPSPNGTPKQYTVKFLTPAHISAVSGIMSAHIQTLPDAAPTKEKDSKVEEKSHHHKAKPVNNTAQIAPKERINKDRVIKHIAQGYERTETRKNERKLIEHSHDETAAKLRDEAKFIEDWKEKNFKIQKNDSINYDMRTYSVRLLTNAVNQLKSLLR